MTPARSKLIAVLFGAAGLVALVVLAAGLQHVRFHDSLPIPGIRPTDKAGDSFIIPGGEQIFMVLLGFLAVMLVISIIYLFFSMEGRKFLIKRLFQLAVVMALFFILANNLVNKVPPLVSAIAEEISSRQFSAGSGGAPPDGSPEWLTWLLSLGAAAMLVGAAYQAWQRWQRRSRGGSAAEDLAESAAQALAALREGKTLKETILQCYQQMIEIATVERKLDRPEFLTASEFIAVLKTAGLPPEAVEQLTHLFEFARYSMHPATPQQNRAAVACLEAIVQASGKGVGTAA